MLKIDHLAYNNRLTDKNPMQKASMSMFLLLLAIFIDNFYLQSAILIFNILLCVFVAKIPTKEYFNLYTIPLAFIIMGVIAILISYSKEKSGFIFSFPIFGGFFGITEMGLTQASKIIARSLACISSTYTFALTTPINQMIYVFKKIHLPRAFMEQFALIYRFITLFFEELSVMKIAIELKQGYVDKKTWINSVSLLGSSLFARIFRSYQDYQIALKLKLFDEDFFY